MSLNYVKQTNIPRLEIYNVKHGDFGIYYGNNGYFCVLDCGSSQRQSKFRNSNDTPLIMVNNIINNNKLKSPKNEILISHFHEDHYNMAGLFCINNKFDNIYLPFINTRFKYIRLAIYGHCLHHFLSNSELNVKFKANESIINLFNGKYATKKTLLSKGMEVDSITDSNGNKAKVLWPPKNHIIWVHSGFEGNGGGLKKTIGMIVKWMEENKVATESQKIEYKTQETK